MATGEHDEEDSTSCGTNKNWLLNQLVSTFNGIDSESDWRIESISDVVEKV